MSKLAPTLTLRQEKTPSLLVTPQPPAALPSKTTKPSQLSRLRRRYLCATHNPHARGHLCPIRPSPSIPRMVRSRARGPYPSSNTMSTTCEVVEQQGDGRKWSRLWGGGRWSVGHEKEISEHEDWTDVPDPASGGWKGCGGGGGRGRRGRGRGGCGGHFGWGG